MPFRIPSAARDFFRHLEADFGGQSPPKAPLFDIYYLCLMAGLASGQHEELSTGDTDELVENFPGEFKEKGRLIVALLLCAELRAYGIELSERKALHAAISERVDPGSPSCLNESGMKRCNEYAYGGFSVISGWPEWQGSKPRHLEAFLPMYKSKIDEALKERGEP